MFAISIGTNLYNRSNNIRDALELLKKNNILIIKTSLIYQNKALIKSENFGDSSCDIDFFNIAALCDCDNENNNPRSILTILKKIEQEMGREIDASWGPRIIDLDLLFFDDLMIDEDDLKIPHPELEKRSFVILPLLEISPDWILNNQKSIHFGKTIAQIYQENFFNLTNNFINTIPSKPEIVAIVNLTPDSFSGDGYLQSDFESSVESICQEIWQKFLNGASVLDFGAQSTTPNATLISSELEIKRIKKIMDYFFSNYYCKSKIFPTISIDSFYPEVIQYCIENYVVDIINDVSGLAKLEMLDLIANSNRKIVLMHNLGIPPKSDDIIDYKVNSLDLLIGWFENKINTILDYKNGVIKKEQIILDPGIGFGKSTYHCWQIIKELDILKKHFQLPILFGHSKKVFLKSISSEDRSNQTLGVSLKVLQNTDYLRIHDVKKHVEVISGFLY